MVNLGQKFRRAIGLADQTTTFSDKVAKWQKIRKEAATQVRKLKKILDVDVSIKSASKDSTHLAEVAQNLRYWSRKYKEATKKLEYYQIKLKNV